MNREPRPRRYMRAALVEAPRVGVAGMRAPAEGDAVGLANLMWSAYQGTIDDEGESKASALAEVRKTFAGDYGAFMPACSKVVVRGRRFLHATLLTRWEDRPFVAFAMTAPAAKRSGLARAALVDAMQDLRAAGHAELRLVVTLANLPARTLYESLGFVIEA